MARDWLGNPLVPGVNVDPVDIARGLREARSIGYDKPTDLMVAEYGLQRWARGEEDGAVKTFLSGGIDLTAAYRIVAAACAIPPYSGKHCAAVAT